MFCPKCGKEMPEGATVCEECAKVAQEPAAEAAATQPAASAIPTAPDGRPLSKNQYFFKAAPSKFKIINYVALALGLICILTVFLSANKFINGSVFKIPIMTMIGAFEDADMEDAQEELDEMCEELEEAIEDDEFRAFERKYNVDFDELEDELDISVEEFLDMLTPLSLNNMVKFAEVFEEDEDEIMIMKAFLNFVRVWAAVIIGLLILAIVFRKTWLTVLSYVCAFLFLPFTGGFVFWLLGSVLFIALAVLFSKLKTEYKFYRRSLGL